MPISGLSLRRLLECYFLMENFEKFVFSCPEFIYLKKYKGGHPLPEQFLPSFQVEHSFMKWVGVQGLAVSCIQELMNGKKIKCE